MAKVSIACGGTGGHLYPGLAVAECLISSGHDVRLYVSDKQIDQKALEKHAHIESVALPTVGWPGLSFGVLRFCKRFLDSYRLCVSEIRSFQPGAVLGMGGFTSAPLIFSAARRRIPTFLHESNAIPGKVTKILASRSDKVLLGFEECAAYLDVGKTHVTGTPVRQSLKKMAREEAAKFWGLDSDKTIIAVMGGSQGAKGLNEMVMKAMSDWKGLHDQLQVIHLSGPNDEGLLSANYMRQGIKAEVRPFCHDMEYVYNLADLIIARSGAASLTEISCFEIPALLVPYPYAAENHQERNAEIFENKGAAKIIREGKGGPALLAREVARLIEKPELLRDMKDRVSELKVDDAARRVAQEVENAL